MNKKAMQVMASTTLAAMVMSSGAFTVFAADGGVYNSKGSVTFEASKDPTDPVDPSDPKDPVVPEGPGGETPQPGTPGPLSIDFASSLDFGTNVISNRDQVYYAAPQKVKVAGGATEERPNYVQISDNRGTNKGWTLTVKQNGQLSNASTLNNELTGAEISLADATATSASTTVVAPTAYDVVLDPDGDEQKVMTAQVGEGAMTWISYYGDVEDVDGEMKNTSVQLEVPGSTPKDSVKYSTTLTWILSDVVTN